MGRVFVTLFIRIIVAALLNKRGEFKSTSYYAFVTDFVSKTFLHFTVEPVFHFFFFRFAFFILRQGGKLII